MAKKVEPPKVKKWYHSRTVWAAILQAIAGLCVVVVEWLAVGDFSLAGLLMLINAVAMFGFRTITDSAIKL